MKKKKDKILTGEDKERANIGFTLDEMEEQNLLKSKPGKKEKLYQLTDEGEKEAERVASSPQGFLFLYFLILSGGVRRDMEVTPQQAFNLLLQTISPDVFEKVNKTGVVKILSEEIKKRPDRDELLAYLKEIGVNR